MSLSFKEVRIFFVRLAFLIAGFLFVFSAWNFAGGGDQRLGVGCEDCIYADYLKNSSSSKQVALTFDDVPTGRYTVSILETLAEKNVPASFFVLGQLAVREPELVNRMIAEGHLIGNHSFTHSRDVHANKERFLQELNRTNRVLETITGYAPILYRPPYLLNIEGHVAPVTDQEPMWVWARENGYVPVGADIDTKDWSFQDSDKLLSKIRSLINEEEHNSASEFHHVVLLHGEPQTARALPEIIDIFREEGYSIVPLTDLLGMTRAEAMPQARVSNKIIYAGFLRFLGMIWPFVVFSSIFIAIVAFSRPFVLLGLKRFLKERRKTTDLNRMESTAYSHRPLVSVLVPAYNEEKNLDSTLDSILSNSQLPDEILVLNDGSTDGTSECAHRKAREFPHVIRVFDLSNGGKAAALNTGIDQAFGDVFIAIDGDTVLGDHCIEYIVKRFDDPSVGAVAGKVVPAVHTTFIEKLQYLEYVIGQAIDKMALSRLGAVNIVPGAIGAWRRDVVRSIGGYSKDTLVEDQDLSLAVLLSGYRVVYESKAVSYTEVPNKLFGFYKQRFRWTFGTFQCMWKYCYYFLNFKAPRIGLVALPYALFFNIILPVLAIVVQVFVVIGLLLQLFSITLLFIILYLQIDLIYALLAYFEERPVDRKYLYLIPLQRVFYIVIYTVLIVAVIVKIFDGSRAGWGKLARSGSAKKFFESGRFKSPGYTEIL